tara:strand:+ start:540 stop:1067 length:528 start_codon:yes stop_codon:yes gene_type:complete
MSNLRLLNETSGSSVTTMSVTDVFTSDFDIYKITLYSESSSEQETHIRLINSDGSTITASDYQYVQLFLRSYAAYSTVQSTGDSIFRLITGSEDDYGGYAVVWVFNPTNTSSYTYILSQMSRGYDLGNDNGFDYNSNKNIGVLENTNSMTGFHILNNNTVSADYTARTYGLRVDS